MSWRTVMISNRAKLDLKLDYLVIRQDIITKIHLSEICLVIIESTAVSLTVALICELMKRKIKVVFCDEKRNPSSELLPYYGSHDTSVKVRRQISWDMYIKKVIWTEIVREKIKQQKDFLLELEKEEAEMLGRYILQIVEGDETNREGHAAKVYFNALFGYDFTRSADIPTNAALNYGYSIILGCFNREIVSNGYITQLGIFHENMFNQFNLASDFMEPYRILIDRCVYAMELEKFGKNEKLKLLSVLNKEVLIDGKIQFVANAIKIYTKSIFDALDEMKVSLIRFYRDEL